MSDTLDFGDGTWEEAGPLVRTTLAALYKDTNGNGRPGLKQDVAEIKATARASLAWMKALALLTGIFITALGIYIGYLESRHRIVEDNRPALSEDYRPQHAGVPHNP